MAGAHAGSKKDGHDDHGHDDFDSSPAKELSPGEPTTPSWVPILGACLFLFAAVYFLVGQTGATPAAGSASAAASVKAAPVPSAKAQPKPPMSAPNPLARGSVPRPTARGTAGPLEPPPALARPPEPVKSGAPVAPAAPRP